MPAVVKEYSSSKSFNKIREIQGNILNAYIADMAKYATSSECVKIRASYDSIPVQLAKENKKFQYKVVQKGASSTTFGASLDWLNLANIIIKCTKVRNAKKPLEGNVDLSSFKMYMSDIGLLTYKSKIEIDDIVLNSPQINDYRGAITENYVAISLLQAGYDLYYWESDGKAEIDFVILRNNQIIPVEAKSADNTRSKSLKIFVNKYKPPYSIRVSSKNFGFENNIHLIPLYAIFAI